VLVYPQTRDFLNDHIYHRFELVAKPARGDPPVIIDADAI